MTIKFFGQFLIDKKAITRLDLLRAIELQEKTNLRFGDLVIAMGMMTAEQRTLTHRAQRHEDLQFGDMAVKMGFLSPDQVKQILYRQQSEHLYLGEALVKLEIISKDKLSFYLEEFKQSQGPSDSKKPIVPAEIPHRSLWEIAADMTYKMLTRVAGVTFQTGPCTMTETTPERLIVIELAISGSVSARYLLAVSENARALLANAILKEDNLTMKSAAEIDAAVKEFVDIIGSNIVNKATQLNYNIDITPAQIDQQQAADIRIPENRIGLLFPVYCSNGEVFELTLVVPRGKK